MMGLRERARRCCGMGPPAGSPSRLAGVTIGPNRNTGLWLPVLAPPGTVSLSAGSGGPSCFAPGGSGSRRAGQIGATVGLLPIVAPAGGQAAS